MDTNRHYIVHFEYCSAGFANPFLLSIHHISLSPSHVILIQVWIWSHGHFSMEQKIGKVGFIRVTVGNVLCVRVSASWFEGKMLNSALQWTVQDFPSQLYDHRYEAMAKQRGSAIIIMFVPQSNCLTMFVHCLSNLFRSSVMILLGLIYLSLL